MAVERVILAMRQPTGLRSTDEIAGALHPDSATRWRAQGVTDVTSTTGVGAAADQAGSVSAIGAALQHLDSDLIALRRSLHAHPEIGFDLPMSTSIIETMLADAGLAPARLAGGTGLVGRAWHRGADRGAARRP